MPKTKKNILQSAMVKAQQAPVEYIAFSGGGAKEPYIQVFTMHYLKAV